MYSRHPYLGLAVIDDGMKFKLDENFGTRLHRLFRVEGHDVVTVCEEKLQGASDVQLFDE